MYLQACINFNTLNLAILGLREFQHLTASSEFII